jgi:hypothetical protein
MAQGSTRPLMRFIFFSTRRLETDFRRFLFEALQHSGFETWHVCIGPPVVVIGPDESSITFEGLSGFFGLIAHLQSDALASNLSVYFDSTGVYRLAKSLVLRAVLPKGVWCFDIHDNLLYDYRGIRRIKALIGLSMLSRITHVNIVLSQELLRLHPTAHHLDNAAHSHRRNLPPRLPSELVVLATIDRRLDFGFLRDTSGLLPETTIHLYGRMRNDDADVKADLERLLRSEPQIVYHGEFRLDDVDSILAPFAIGLAPYAINHELTRYINPDKYYLYLNSGMEVVSTAIPQAKRMEGRIHVVSSPHEAAEVVRKLQSSNSLKNLASVEEFLWADRARELVAVVHDVFKRTR